jgi:hypothetical protein
MIFFMKNNYKFEGTPVSQLKLNPATPLENQSNDRPRDNNYGGHHQYRGRGNYHHHNNRFNNDRRQFSN